MNDKLDIGLRQWPSLLVHGGLFGFLAGLFFWKLGRLTNGYSAIEQATLTAGTSWSGILHDPLNAPLHAVLKLWQMAGQHSLLGTRLVGVVIGLLCSVAFYAVIRHWNGSRVALAATLLFGSSAAILHTARLGTPEMLSLVFFLLVAAGVWLKSSQSAWAVLACFVFIAILLYVPGMVWLLVIGAAWQWKTLDEAFKKHLAIVSAGALLLAASCAPLIMEAIKHPAILKEWVGLPATGWPNVGDFLHSLVLQPFHIIVHMPSDPLHWLGTAPLFDIFTVVALVLGIYLSARNWRLQQSQAALGFILIILVLASLKIVPFWTVIPFLYIPIATGLHYVLTQWFNVFPRNPIARAVGVGVFCLVLFLSSAFGIRHYFVGWPEAPATRSIFIIR